MNKKEFRISSIQVLGSGDEVKFTTNPDETPSTITITKYDGKKITIKIKYGTILKRRDYQLNKLLE